MEQLIGPWVTLFDIHTGAEMDEAALWDKRGITPEQVIDFLALTGDTVDNIPGVKGIPPKIAAKLLQQFDSLQEILDALGDNSQSPGSVSGKVRANLERARPRLDISRRLVTLEKESDIAFDLEQARARPIPVEELIGFCDELGFVSFKKQCLQLAGE